jgi:N-acetylglucosaminyldiphosphoundecaprenol N-acetyl-beta-D-mannosaminyltransferase
MPVGKQVALFGIRFDCLTMSEAIASIEESIDAKRALRIGVVNAAKAVNMQQDPELFRDVTSSDLTLADGSSIVWASRLLGRALPERVAGIDLMWEMLELSNRKRYRVFCLGATEEVSAGVAAAIAEKYPRAQLAGRHHGYFSEAEEPNVAKAIRDSQADILFVAITSPKKERFMSKWADSLAVTVIHGVGGSFDIVAGKTKRAPRVLQQLGLEWLYRVAQEPGRLWKRYLITNTLFFGLLLKSLLRGRSG